MSPNDVTDEQRIRRMRSHLPTYVSTRDTATGAVTRTARDIGLELSERDARELALAVVDQVDKAIMVQGADWAYRVVEAAVNDTERHLIAPATAMAAVDPKHAAVLRVHRQYLSGMTEARRRLRNCLLSLAEQSVSRDKPRTVALTVQPASVEAGHVGERATVQAGVA